VSATATALDVIEGRARWSLALGDCVEGMRGLPDKCVDHIVTDPPYSEHVHANSRRGAKANAAAGIDGYSRMRDLGFAALTQGVLESTSDRVADLVKRWALVFSDTESSHLWRGAMRSTDLLEYVRTCFWDRVGSAPQFTGDRPAVACEAITVCHPPGRKQWNGGGKRGIYRAYTQHRSPSHSWRN
jgi:hypothetical protein